jgi:hypothetical protein
LIEFNCSAPNEAKLLNSTTYQVEDDWSASVSYAILSRTWGVEEILFQDLYPTPKPDWQTKRGFIKIRYACEQALRDGYEYIWVDNCCIKKESSAELSEAINSMFRWYKDASICYAYLSDASGRDDASLSSSRWFTCGWCLQELIAPDHVHFYTNLGHTSAAASRLP